MKVILGIIFIVLFIVVLWKQILGAILIVVGLVFAILIAAAFQSLK